MQISYAPTKRSARNEQKRKLDFVQLSELNANRLNTYSEKRAPRQAKETRFSAVNFLNKNANRFSAYIEAQVPQQVEKGNQILCGQLSEQKCE
jgi:hypothetical protein